MSGSWSAIANGPQLSGENSRLLCCLDMGTILVQHQAIDAAVRISKKADLCLDVLVLEAVVPGLNNWKPLLATQPNREIATIILHRELFARRHPIGSGVVVMVRCLRLSWLLQRFQMLTILVKNQAVDFAAAIPAEGQFRLDNAILKPVAADGIDGYCLLAGQSGHQLAFFSSDSDLCPGRSEWEDAEKLIQRSGFGR